MKRFLMIIIFGIVLISSSGVANSIDLPWKKEQPQVELDETSQQARILYAQNDIDAALKLLKSKYLIL